MKAVEVKSLSSYEIEVKYDDGVCGVVDLSDLVQQGVFQVLKDKQLFDRVSTDGSAVIWSEDLEIDADNIYAEILNVNPSQLHISTFHAAD